jgi:hypothetical protein
MIEKEQILSEIRRTAEENGGAPLGRNRFLTETGIREADWLGRYWARWSDAVSEAGFTPNSMVSRVDDGEALRYLALETRRLGHLPTYAELRLRRRSDSSFPGTGIYERLGPKGKLAIRLAAFCEEHVEFTDVRELIAPLLETANDSSSEMVAEDDGAAKDGFVYLMKSGHHYKLGRTNSLGRRGYELAIQLPERAAEVHAIKTDDPAGIEAYWHKRFADKRTNGEWFDLSAADVRAFKRRKFM